MQGQTERRRAGVRLDGTPTNQIIAAEPVAPQASDARRYELTFGDTLVAGTLQTGVVYNLETDCCEAFINGRFVFTNRALIACINRLRREGHDVTEIEPTDAPTSGAPVAAVSCPQIATVAVLRAHLESKGVDIQSEMIGDALPLEPLEIEPSHEPNPAFCPCGLMRDYQCAGECNFPIPDVPRAPLEPVVFEPPHIEKPLPSFHATKPVQSEAPRLVAAIDTNSPNNCRRRFWASCKSAGLEENRKRPHIAALNAYFGWSIESTNDLTPAQWNMATDAVRGGVFLADWSLARKTKRKNER